MRGVPRDPFRGPVAHYLQSTLTMTGLCVDLLVLDRSVHVRRPGGRVPVIVRLPQPVSAFVALFDNGAYPSLIDLFGNRETLNEQRA